MYQPSQWNVSRCTLSSSHLRFGARSEVHASLCFHSNCDKNQHSFLLFSPNLTWRDVMYITVLGSRPFAIPSNTDLVNNAAGFNGTLTSSSFLHQRTSSLASVSSKYGFGLMDAGLMTWYAARWTNVPPMSTCQSLVNTTQRTIRANSHENWNINVTACETLGPSARTIVNYIEQVQVIISLNADRRGDMEIFLFSPSKTKTQLLPVDRFGIEGVVHRFDRLDSRQ